MDKSEIKQIIKEEYVHHMLGKHIDTSEAKLEKEKFTEPDEMRMSEAPMDKSFAKDWDKSVTALSNHLAHELKVGKGVIGQTNLGMIKKMLDAVKQVKSIPSLLGKIVGESVNEAKLNKKDVAYQLSIDYSGNTKPKVTKLNNKGITVFYGYKVNPKDVIKSLNKLEPSMKIKHKGWSDNSSGGGAHSFIFEGKLNEDFSEHKRLNNFLKGKTVEKAVLDEKGKTFAIVFKGGMYVAFDTDRASFGNASRLKLEGKLNESDENYRKALEKIARDKQLKMLSKKDKDTLLKIADLMKRANEGTIDISEEHLAVLKEKLVFYTDKKGKKRRFDTDASANKKYRK